MDLIEQLKKEHQDLLVTFSEVDNAEDDQTKLNTVEKLQKKIRAHLKKEDALYDFMREVNNDEIQRIGKFFYDNMKKYAEEFEQIVENIINQDGKMDQEISERYSELKSKIIERINIEENILFKSYEMYN